MEMRNALTMEEHGMQSETGALSLLRLHLRSIRHPVHVLTLYYEILYNIRFIRDFGARVSACRYNKQPRQLRRQTMTVKLKIKSAMETDCYEQCRLRLLPHLQRSRHHQRTHRVAPLPSPRQAAWILLRSEQLKDEEKKVVDDLCLFLPEVRRAQELAKGFFGIVRERKADELRAWLIDALQSQIPEFMNFANGIMQDLQAVKAALSYEWSQGQVEGQVNRLKLLKRQMYGRAKLDLLRARVLHAN
ncbi:MAG TPA: transposase [Pyrinomonadaceae bacterium]|nr:transposase [Pyrinomonadaceae bacterium]